MTLVARPRRHAGHDLAGRVARVLALPASEQRRTVHALLTLVAVEALIRWVRLPRLAGLLGVALVGRGRVSATSLDRGVEGAGRVWRQDGIAVSEAAVRATSRVLRVWPFGRGPCLREALVLGHLLRRYDPVLRIGVARAADDVRAHAWLEVDGRVLGSSRGYATFDLGPGAAA